MQYLANNYDKEQILKLTINLNQLLRISEVENHKLRVEVAESQELVKLASNRYCKLFTQITNSYQENEKFGKQRKQLKKQTNQYIASLKEQNNEINQKLFQIQKNKLQEYQNIDLRQNQFNKAVVQSRRMKKLLNQQIMMEYKNKEQMHQLILEFMLRQNDFWKSLLFQIPILDLAQISQMKIIIIYLIIKQEFYNLFYLIIHKFHQILNITNEDICNLEKKTTNYNKRIIN